MSSERGGGASGSGGIGLDDEPPTTGGIGLDDDFSSGGSLGLDDDVVAPRKAKKQAKQLKIRFGFTYGEVETLDRERREGRWNGTLEALGLTDEREQALAGSIDSTTLLERLDQLVRRRADLEGGNRAEDYAFLKKKGTHEGFRQWFDELTRLRDATKANPTAGRQAFRAFVVSEQTAFARSELHALAVKYWSDGVVEPAEWEALRIQARGYHLGDDDALAAIRAAGKRPDWTPPVAARTDTFDAYEDWLLPGQEEVQWSMPELVGIILDARFDNAVIELNKGADELGVPYWMKSQRSRLGNAFKVWNEAKKTYDNEQNRLKRELVVWIFVWGLGHSSLHLDDWLRPTSNPRDRVDGLRQLVSRLRERPRLVLTLARLLEGGLLEEWLRMIPRDEAAAQVAKAARLEAASADARVRGSIMVRGVLRALWRGGAKWNGLTLIAADDGSSGVVDSIDALRRFVREKGTEALADAFESGTLAAWAETFDRGALPAIQRALREGPHAHLAWTWSEVHRKLALAATTGKRVEVESLRELIDSTDAGRARLVDELVTTGRLALWCRFALKDEHSVALIEQIRGDARGSKGERVRQALGAAALQIAGGDASTPGALAALVSANARLPQAAYDAFCAAAVQSLEAGLPQARYSKSASDVAAALDALAARRDISVEARTLFIPMICGTACLTVREGGEMVVLAAAGDECQALRSEGLRRKLRSLLASQVLGLWIRCVRRAPPADMIASLERAEARARADDETAVDSALRWVSGASHLWGDLFVRDFAELQAVAREVEKFSLLGSRAVRDRIRDALGAFGGPALAGAPSLPKGPDEAAMANADTSLAAHGFAWTWLGAHVLWIPPLRRFVESLPEFLACLDDPVGYGAVRDLMASRVGVEWLRGAGIDPRLSALLGKCGVVGREHFPALLASLGDFPKNLDLRFSKQRITLQEGGSQGVSVSIRNGDPTRELRPRLLDGSDDGLEARVSGGGGGVAAGGVEALPVVVSSRQGVSGAKCVAVELVVDDLAGQPHKLARATLPLAVQFPLRALLLGGGIGAAAGAVITTLWFAAKSAIFSNKPSEAIASSLAGTPMTSDEGLAQGILVGTLILLTLIVYGVGVYLSNQDPKETDWEWVRRVGFVAGVIAMPLGGFGGCAQGCRSASGCVASCTGGVTGLIGGLIGGALLGLGVAAFLAIRPGARIRSGGTALLIDLLLVAPALAGLVALRGLTNGAIYLAYAQDVALASLASALGAKGPWSNTWFIAPALIFGGLIGLAIGLRRAWASIERPLIGWASVTGLVLLLFVIGALGGKPGVVFAATAATPPKVATATEEECRRAAERAIDVLADSPGVGLPSGLTSRQYRATRDYDDELREATLKCQIQHAEAAEARCIEQASSSSEVMECGPFWFGLPSQGER